MNLKETFEAEMDFIRLPASSYSFSKLASPARTIYHIFISELFAADAFLYV